MVDNAGEVVVLNDILKVLKDIQTFSVLWL